MRVCRKAIEVAMVNSVFTHALSFKAMKPIDLVLGIVGIAAIVVIGVVIMTVNLIFTGRCWND